MASQLENLARQFKEAGHEDIGAGIFSWAPIIRQRGIESFAVPVIPEGAQEFSVEIGGKTEDQYLQLLKDSGVHLSSGTDYLIDRSIATSSEVKRMDLVKLRVADLGFINPATTDKIFERAQARGFQLVPAEIGLAQRLADK